MKWSNVRWIFLREVRDQLRDRRTIFTIVVLPLLLYPLLGMSFLQVTQFSREHSTPVLIVGSDALPETPQLMLDGAFHPDLCNEREARLLELEIRPHPDDWSEGRLRTELRQVVGSGEYSAVVYFRRDFDAKLAQFRRAILLSVERDGGTEFSGTVPEPEMFVSSANDKSRIARDRIERILSRWRSAIVEENLRQSRIPLAATEPFDVVKTDVAGERSKRAAVWSKLLPFVVLIWALTGAFYPAVDLCAGEKERGTLETLLSSPALRCEIVWGKLFTVMAFSIATSLLNMGSLGLTGLFVLQHIRHLGGEAEFLMGAPPFSSTGWILLALLPVSALFSALSLAVAAFARSSKEGQYYLMPLLLIMLPLMLLPLLPAAELDLGTSLIPVTGVMLLLKSLIEGHYLVALRFSLPVIGVTGICSLLAIRWAVDQFSNESVLFPESERWGVAIWFRHMLRDRAETPTIAEGVFCGLLLLLIRFFASFLVGMPRSWPDFATSTVVSLLAFTAAPALLMAVMLTRSPRKTLLLRMPRPSVLPMAVLLGVVIHPLGMALGEGVRHLYPLNEDILGQMAALGDLIDQAPIWSLLAVLALAPAICEELAFRGFILSGLRHLGHRWGAILVSSLFFGAAHGILQQSLTACVVGIVIGYLVIQSGSLLAGILFHFTYNSLSLLVAVAVPDLTGESALLDWLFTSGGGVPGYQWPAILAGLLLTTAVLAWFRGLPHEASAEETLQNALDRQLARSAAK